MKCYLLGIKSRKYTHHAWFCCPFGLFHRFRGGGVEVLQLYVDEVKANIDMLFNAVTVHHHVHPQGPSLDPYGLRMSQVSS